MYRYTVLPDFLSIREEYYHHAQVDFDFGQAHIVWWLSYCQVEEKISVEPWEAMVMSSNGNIFAFVQGIHRSPVNSPHKSQWCGTLMFSLIFAWINDWVNNCEAGDLRCHLAHYDITVMIMGCWSTLWLWVPSCEGTKNIGILNTDQHFKE